MAACFHVRKRIGFGLPRMAIVSADPLRGSIIRTEAADPIDLLTVRGAKEPTSNVISRPTIFGELLTPLGRLLVSEETFTPDAE